jgi:enoyl-CoA hydratase/carnithine racemase
VPVLRPGRKTEGLGVAGSIDVRREGPVAWVALDHPEKFNAMTRAMWQSLRSRFEEFAREASLRCVVVCGSADNFCSGGDISEYSDFRFDPVQLRQFHEEEVWGTLSAILLCDVPVIACIKGACMGGGLEIAACCDLRIAASSASFGAPIARLGFPMAPRETQLLVHALGSASARAVLLAAETFTAAQLQAQGFLLRVVADHELNGHAQAFAQNICALAPQAARMNKQILRALATQAQDTSPVSGALPFAYADSAEHHEGIAAFLEKRTPRFE